MTTFNKVAEAKGNNSQAEKVNLLEKLLLDAEKEEGKFIVRWLEGNLKVGAGEQTVISALARAVCVTPFNQKEKINMRSSSSKQAFDERTEKVEADIKRAISEFPDYEALVNALVKVGDKTEKLSEHCFIRPGKYINIKIIGVPVKPMLAKPTKGVQVVLKRFENVDFTCEYKYDGFRGQIHYVKTSDGHKINVFSRNLEDMTESYPDVAAFFKENIQPNVEDFIMDSEIVAYDRTTV